MTNEKSSSQRPSLEEIRRYIESWGEEPLVTHQIATNVYWVAGAGGNSGIVVGRRGVVVIDAKVSSGAGKRLLDEVARITSNPVTHVILTHGDGDHVMGLASFPAGVTIISHENCKTDMEAANAVALMGQLPSRAMPNCTFTTRFALTIEGVCFEFFHFGPSHTSGDTVVHLPDERVIFAGDILAWGGSPTPTIHDEKHGSASGWLATVREMLKLPADIFVTGHGDVQTKVEIQQKLDEFQQQYDEIEVMVARGRSLEEVEEAMAVDSPAPLAGGLRLASFASVAYHQLKKTKVGD